MLNTLLLGQWFLTGWGFAPARGYVAISGDIFSCHNWGSATGTQWVEAMDSAKHTTLHRTAPNNKE